MKAVFLTAYGSPDHLDIREIAKPHPAKGQVLIRVKASTVTLGDCEIRTLTLPRWTRIPVRMITGWSRPRNFGPGMEIAGVVEEVGEDVTAIKPGDRVFGSTGMGMRGNSDFVVRPAKAVAIIPPGVSFEEAATVPVGGINAFHFLSKANIQPGQKVLVIGAGGSIGTYGIQLAKMYGAEITAIDHTEKLDMLKEIGAEHVIDYTREDFASQSRKYDVVFDMIYSSSFEKCIGVLKDTGVYLMANTDPGRMIRASLQNKRRVIFQLAAETPGDLAYVANLIKEKKIKPVIDRTYKLDQIREAHSYVETGAKKGCVIISHGE